MKTNFQSVLESVTRVSVRSRQPPRPATLTNGASRWCNIKGEYLIIYIITYIISTHVTPFPLEMCLQ